MIASSAEWIKKKTGPVFRQLFYLVGKIGLTVLLSVVGGWVWVVFLFWSQALGPMAIKIAVAAGMGIGAGILARFILAHNTFVLRRLTAFFSMAISLLDLYRFTGERVGFNFYQATSFSAHWDALWQLVLGGLCGWTALSVWRPTVRIQYLPALALQDAASTINPRPQANFEPVQDLRSLQEPDPTPALASAPPPRAAVTQPSRRKNPHNRPAHARKNTTRKSAPASRPAANPPAAHTGARLQAVQAKINAAARAFLLAGRQMMIKKTNTPVVKFRRLPQNEHRHSRQSAASPRNSSLENHSTIRLVGEEEHRCPYCLELVNPRDPEGVVICPICHTYHHKGCWDVTGTCQVPHMQG